jgi:hypothetical protein
MPSHASVSSSSEHVEGFLLNLALEIIPNSFSGILIFIKIGIVCACARVFVYTVNPQ